MLGKPSHMLYVRNLAPSITQTDIDELFSTCEGYKGTTIIQEITGKVFATIVLRTEEGFQQALALNGTVLKGNTIEVSDDENPETKWSDQRGQEDLKNTVIFIGDLSDQTTEDNLRRFFEQCGPIERVSIPRNKNGRSGGFGRVTFVSANSVEKALVLNNSQLDGRNIKINIPDKGPLGSPLRANEGGIFDAPTGTTGSLFGNGPRERNEGGLLNAPQNNEIFVKGFAFSTTEETLRRFFEPCGEIERVYVPAERDGRSKGAAFITFVSEDAARQAVALNNNDLDGRSLTIEHIARTIGAPTGSTGSIFGNSPRERNEGGLLNAPQNNEIFVKGLAFSTTEESLRRFFEPYGEIERVNLLVGPDGRSKGCASIRFVSEDAARQAVVLNNNDLDGRSLTIEHIARTIGAPTNNGRFFDAPRGTTGGLFGNGPRERNEGGLLNAPQNNEIIVKGLGFKTTEETLRRFFERCGEIERVNLLVGPEGRSKGIAFIRFVSEDAARQAAALNNCELENRYLTIECIARTIGAPVNNDGALFGAPRGTPGGLFGGGPRGGNSGQSFGTVQNNAIFVGNLSFQTTEESLQRFFEQCGPIESIRVAKGPEGRSRGIGHVTFFNVNSAEQALTLNKTQLDGRNIRIEFAGGRTTFGNAPKANQGGFTGDSQNKPSATGKALNVTSPVKAVLDNLFAGDKDKTTSEASIVKRKAQAMFEKLYTSKKFADVTFDVQGEEILAHKAILSQESKYFEHLLSGQSQSEMIRITIPDVTSNVFKAMLEYVYCNEIKADEDLVIELFKLSETYQIPDMKLKCEDTLKSLLSTQNFVKMAKVIHEYKTLSLKEALLHYTLKNGVDTIDKKDLNEIPREILIEMVDKLSQRTVQAQSSQTQGQLSSGFGLNTSNAGMFGAQQYHLNQNMQTQSKGSITAFTGNRVKL